MLDALLYFPMLTKRGQEHPRGQVDAGESRDHQVHPRQKLDWLVDTAKGTPPEG